MPERCTMFTPCPKGRPGTAPSLVHRAEFSSSSNLTRIQKTLRPQAWGPCARSLDQFCSFRPSSGHQVAAECPPSRLHLVPIRTSPMRSADSIGRRPIGAPPTIVSHLLASKRGKLLSATSGRFVLTNWSRKWSRKWAGGERRGATSGGQQLAARRGERDERRAQRRWRDGAEKLCPRGGNWAPLSVRNWPKSRPILPLRKWLVEVVAGQAIN